jgi:hypothetical protein
LGLPRARRQKERKTPREYQENTMRIRREYEGTPQATG